MRPEDAVLSCDVLKPLEVNAARRTWVHTSVPNSQKPSHTTHALPKPRCSIEIYIIFRGGRVQLLVWGFGVFVAFGGFLGLGDGIACFVVAESRSWWGKLGGEATWSKATYTYGEAACLATLGEHAEAKRLMERVQGLRQKIARKSIPVEYLPIPSDDPYLLKPCQPLRGGSGEMTYIVRCTSPILSFDVSPLSRIPGAPSGPNRYICDESACLATLSEHSWNASYMAEAENPREEYPCRSTFLFPFSLLSLDVSIPG
ncbi:hypothetical protein EDB19DRAFT_1829265 [Suillus lakei]|nr:hypothetical protein EDB19DRAFT_1829265 [Suillus lakei]